MAKKVSAWKKPAPKESPVYAPIVRMDLSQKECRSLFVFRYESVCLSQSNINKPTDANERARIFKEGGKIYRTEMQKILKG